jgi:hypothetical protein
LAILVKFYVILGEEGNAVVVIAELANRNKGAGFEAIEDVASFGEGRESGGKGNSSSFAWFDRFAVRNLDGRAGVGGADIDTMWSGGWIEVMARCASVDYGCVVGKVCFGGD